MRYVTIINVISWLNELLIEVFLLPFCVLK